MDKMISSQQSDDVPDPKLVNVPPVTLKELDAVLSSARKHTAPGEDDIINKSTKGRIMSSAPAPRKRKANGYKFPDKLPKGEILRDTAKKDWVLGESIGQGGFGEIYSAAEGTSKNDWSYVIKIEPHENGPLFMEKNFYIKAAKPADINSWKQKEGLKSLGMPAYIGSGTHFYKNVKYRFLVIERFGSDLWSLFLKAKSFPPHTVYKCALQIIDTLHYIHSKEYVHGDIKGANLLLGRKPGTENTVFLVDFGLACRYMQKEFQKDPKQAHNGTIEYTSCDWHLGVPTRRGDLEILGYNLLHWLAGQLPWEKDINNKETVHKKKQELMSNVEPYMKKHFPGIPQVMALYMAYVSQLKYNEEPNYKYVKGLFIKQLKQLGSLPNGPLEFQISQPSAAASSSRRVSTRMSMANVASDDENESTGKVSRKLKTGKPKVVATNGQSGSVTNEKLPIAPTNDSAKAGVSGTKKNTVKPKDDEDESDEENYIPPKTARDRKRRIAKRTPVRNEVSKSDTDEQEISPILPVKAPGRAAKKAAASNDQTNDANDVPPRIGRKPRAVKPAAAAPVDDLNDSDSDDNIPASPVKRSAKSTSKATKRTKASASKPKPSWKDAPGVQWQLKKNEK